MYIRIKKFHRNDGIKTYYYVVRGVREANRTKQQVVKYLGTIESIMEKMEIAEQIIHTKRRIIIKEE